jgi:hypothetical protein
MNQKGLDSIVAVVILIAISVILSMSIYFWIAGFSKQPGPTGPAVIQLNALCGRFAGSSTQLIVIHASPAGYNTITPSADLLYLKPGGSPTALTGCNPDTLPANGGQTSCTIPSFATNDGTLLVMPAANKAIGSAVITC